MHVSSSEAGRAVPTTATALRGLVVALLVLVGAFGTLPASAGASPKLLKKSKVVAPKANTPVSGTLRGSRCSVHFPATSRSVKITVTGPLSAKRPKTHKLRVKGSRKATCTWATKSYADGKYRFAVKAKVRASRRWWNVSIKRAVIIRNTKSVTSSSGAAGAGGEGPQLGVGNARYVGRLETAWDSWLTAAAASPERQAWMRQHMWGLVAQSTFFDTMTSWSPPALVYKDLYAVYRDDSATLAAHPDWVLKDGSGQRMSIPWNCTPAGCPQLAGDVGNPAFRENWIQQAKVALTHGYGGLWIDDANMEMRVSDAAGNEKPPVDPRTGVTMTFANWRRYIAEFLEQIRREIPNTQLVANVLWFGGTSIGRDADPYIQRAYTAVNRLNLERGFNDDGLTNGSAPRDIWSVDSFMQFIDRMHDRGIPVTLDSAGVGRGAFEYNLAGFFMVDRGNDAVGELHLTPGDWWSGWDVKLGLALGERTRGSDGVFRRSFQKGLVLLNPQRAGTVKVTLPRAMKRVDGSVVTSVTLPPGRGAVLQL